MPPKDEQLAALASLNEPMRRRLYEFVAQQEGTVSRDDVVSALGIARSVVAFHLDKLVDLGLLDVEFRRPEGRRGPGAGRPAKFYRRAAAEIAMSVPDRHYDIAALLLARALEMAEDRSISATTALRAVARDYGHSISSGVERPDGSVSASLENVCSLLARHGYEPRPEGRVVVLANCPFHALAEEHRELVCGMNLELIRGAVQAAGLPGVVARLDPKPGRCCVTLVNRSPGTARGA
jgi:predicted ArsR family transcriptional regulator